MVNVATPTIVDDPFGDQEETTIGRGGPVSGGRREKIVPPPPLPEWASPDSQDYRDGVDDEPDYGDLEAINKDLLHLRVRMNRIRREMRAAARRAVEAKLVYQRALRRALVAQSGGSAETRKAHAELQCENLEAEHVMAQQVSDEYSTLFRAARDDVENAKTVAYNLRALSQL